MRYSGCVSVIIIGVHYHCLSCLLTSFFNLTQLISDYIVILPINRLTFHFRFNCYVFQCTNPDKAHTLALAIAKAFYLAYQIIQEQQGQFPPPPERELLFEPQRPDDTTSHPQRPAIQVSDDHRTSDTEHPEQVVAEVC